MIHILFFLTGSERWVWEVSWFDGRKMRMFLYETVFLCGWSHEGWWVYIGGAWREEKKVWLISEMRKGGQKECVEVSIWRSITLVMGIWFFFWNFQLIDWGKRKMGNWIRQDLGFCIDNYVDEQMAEGVEVKELIEKQDLESELHRASEDGRGWWTVRKWIVDSWMGSLQKVEELWQRWSSEKWVESRRDSGLNARGLKWRCWR